MLLVIIISPTEIMSPARKPNQPMVLLANMYRKKPALNQKVMPERVSAFLFNDSWRTNLKANMTI